jgi:hypothetical protein
MNTIIVEEKIVPKIMNYQNKIYDILYVDPKLVIKNFKINLERFKLHSLILSNPHPNCNPNTKIFCLPPDLLGKKIEDVRNILNYLISVYNMDSCYFSPWGLIKYKERERII